MREKTTPLQAEDIADTIFYALSRPPHVSVNEILVRPTEQQR
jgi:NADP-dependent 3-hydroxy acid dehydrogenase YdfG